METIQNFPEITKKDFPLLNNNIKSNEQIIYLDHAATTQKPIQVLKKIDEYYRNFNANVHRGAHQLSAKATEEFENARYSISKYIKANSTKEIIFTRNATEAINLAARLIASVAFLVKIISFVEFAFINLLIKYLAFSNSSVALALN